MARSGLITKDFLSPSDFFLTFRQAKLTIHKLRFGNDGYDEDFPGFGHVPCPVSCSVDTRLHRPAVRHLPH